MLRDGAFLELICRIMEREDRWSSATASANESPNEAVMKSASMGSEDDIFRNILSPDEEAFEEDPSAENIKIPGHEEVNETPPEDKKRKLDPGSSSEKRARKKPTGRKIDHACKSSDWYSPQPRFTILSRLSVMRSRWLDLWVIASPSQSKAPWRDCITVIHAIVVKSSRFC